MSTTYEDDAARDLATRAAPCSRFTVDQGLPLTGATRQVAISLNPGFALAVR